MDAISTGDLPSWDLGVQLFDDDFADRFAFDVLDPTKLIPEEDVPVEIVGRLTLDRVVDNFFAETEQVAFCTNNVVPGIDFTNDPLLQGRNFSYLDTQLKRLGSPNFTHIPVNAPRCPVAHFQQDGHMAVQHRSGRVNYEPNSWEGDDRGPREDPSRGFQSYPAEESGEMRRLRPESFADHYSQARQFWASQLPVEQDHIVDAFTFELSKVERVDIRERTVANLRNVDDDLARRVSDGLGLARLPRTAKAAVEPREDLAPSPALSLLGNGPSSFAGRKVGLLVTDGADAAVVAALTKAVEKEGATIEVVAPAVGGVRLDDRSDLAAQQMVGGGPSVLYDAVAIVVSAADAEKLAADPAAKDFVTDAHAHAKVIGHTADAAALLAAAGVDGELDDGYVDLAKRGAPKRYVEACRGIRHWPRVAPASEDPPG